VTHCSVAKTTWILIACALVLAAGGCATRYRNNPDDWAGGNNRDFGSDFAECQNRMDEGGIRVRGDSRELFLSCMERRGWYPKESG
jgi:hypothetical protein